ncbi:hypothetical protein GCM10009122_52790 [Fulvivirga kasyanovii]|uniref:Uncharacterized protein n=1 Tax=Fulvivirga kasyanovii TaxID=396812 RepID=A0ABW9RK13_9BACT|nr:hypothetical protein [Fulvivirga kasyanovii]MTI24286.1 hypothetical protein [Fulvivirga kasyanovii]
MNRNYLLLITILIWSCQSGSEKGSLQVKGIADNEDVSVDLPAFHNYELFIGKDMIDSVHEYVYGIEFKVLDSTTINYRITQMINWQNPKVISGVAKLDIKTLRSDDIVFSDWEGKKLSAYKFYAQENGCLIEILISKHVNHHLSIAQAFQVCNHEVDTLTTPLHHK